MGKNVEQLSFMGSPDPFKHGRKWMKEQDSRRSSANLPASPRKRVANDATYAEFMEKGSELSGDIGVSTEEKAGLLRTYFPARFGENGKQPLDDMQDYQIGAVFNHLMNYSRGRMGQ